MSELTPHAEQVPSLHGIPLRLSFTPDAIREHFDCDDTPEGKLVAALTDDQLAEVGYTALTADSLYAAFHDCLVDAVRSNHAALADG